MNKHIDDIVKNALERYEVPYDPTSWDAMQQRIDQEIVEDFDNEIKTAVGDVNKAYQHKHWLQLKEWLDYSWYATNKIYINKIAECALMLLALFTFFNYSGHQQQKFDKAHQAQAHQIHVIDKSTTHVGPSGNSQLNVGSNNIIGTSIKLSTNDRQTETNTGLAADIKLEKANNATLSVRSGINGHDQNSTIKQTPATTFLPTTNENKSSNESDIPKNIVDPMAVLESESEQLDDQIALMRNTGAVDLAKRHTSLVLGDADALLDNAEPVFDIGTAVNEMALNDLLALTYSKASELQSVPHPTIAKTKNPFDRKWAISAFTDLNFNHITTPYDELYLKSGYNQNRVGYGGGLMVHRDMGPIEVSTGVGYSSKKYSPKQFVELFKRSEDSEGTEYRFDGVKLNVLTIPIHASYFISKKGKWRPYVTIGGAVHLALQAEYKKEDRPVSRSTSVPQYLNENQGATYTVGRTPNFEKKKFPDGLLENGSFEDNHYFTLDLGFGVERKLSPSTSLFLQPTVFYNLFNKGLSANGDKINTFAMQIGVKTRL